MIVDDGIDEDVKEKPLKIVLLGDSNVGKTVFSNRVASHVFTDRYIRSIGVECLTIQISCNNCTIQNELLDVSGAELEKISTLLNTYIKDAHGFLVFCDLTNKNSFDKIPEIIKKIRASYPHTPPIILVGTKSDLYDEYKVTIDNLIELNAKLKCNGVFLVSSNTGYNVDEVMQAINNNILSPNDSNRDSFEEVSIPENIQPVDTKKIFTINYDMLYHLDCVWNNTEGETRAKITAILKDYTKSDLCFVGRFFATIKRNHVFGINSSVSSVNNISNDFDGVNLIHRTIQTLDTDIPDGILENASGAVAHIKYFLNTKLNNKKINYPEPDKSPEIEDSTEGMPLATQYFGLR